MIEIKIHRCNEKEPAWPDQKAEAELHFKNATVIEQGMSGGNTSVAFTLEDPATGKLYMAQTSAGILRMLLGAIKGAEDRWLEHPVENIWK